MADQNAYIEATCAVLMVPLDPAWLPAIAFNVAAIRHQADVLLADPVGDLVEAAPVFTV